MCNTANLPINKNSQYFSDFLRERERVTDLHQDSTAIVPHLAWLLWGQWGGHINHCLHCRTGNQTKQQSCELSNNTHRSTLNQGGIRLRAARTRSTHWHLCLSGFLCFVENVKARGLLSNTKNKANNYQRDAMGPGGSSSDRCRRVSGPKHKHWLNTLPRQNQLWNLLCFGLQTHSAKILFCL